jgi:hypothetical protein
MKNIIINKCKIASDYNLEIIFKLFNKEFIFSFLKLEYNYLISFKFIQ